MSKPVRNGDRRERPQERALAGGCACGKIRYRLTSTPLIVHACHCRDCQRITGGPFVINIWIEKKFVEPTAGEPRSFRLAGGSGKNHEVYFCPDCGTYLWSRYHIVPRDCLFVRAGTLDRPEVVTPDVHIFTRTKLPWVEIPKDVRRFESRYKLDEVWSAESLERFRRLPEGVSA